MTQTAVKVLVFSDIHGDVRALEKLAAAPADIYSAAGDLSNFGRALDACAKILAPLKEKVWMLPGNHETEEQIARLCEQFGFVNFQKRVKKIGNTRWAGLGYSNITPFNTPGEYTEEQIGEILKGMAVDGEGELYVAAHVPPIDTKLDEVAKGKHAGSKEVRKWVEEKRPKYLFCGHIHECEGREDRIGETKCFNVGKKGYLVEV